MRWPRRPEHGGLAEGGAVVVSLCCLLLTVTAAGEKPLKRSEIEDLVIQADALRTSKPTAAADLLEEAYNKHKISIFLINAARFAEEAQDLERAVRLYELFLRHEPGDHEAADIRKHIALLKSVQGNPQAQPVALRRVRSLVRIDSDPQGAPVSVYERTDPKAAPARAPSPQQAGRRWVIALSLRRTCFRSAWGTTA